MKLITCTEVSWLVMKIWNLFTHVQNTFFVCYGLQEYHQKPENFSRAFLLMPHARTPCNSVLGVYNSCKWNCQSCACVNRSQVVMDNQLETLVAETLGMRLVILVQEPISGNETRFMRCHCMQNCLSSSTTVCLRMWTGRGMRARTQELSATFSSCGQCRLSSEWTRVIKTGGRFDTIYLNICQAACIWQFPSWTLTSCQ